jgi:hypothetical protein
MHQEQPWWLCFPELPGLPLLGQLPLPRHKLVDPLVRQANEHRHIALG